MSHNRQMFISFNLPQLLHINSNSETLYDNEIFYNPIQWPNLHVKLFTIGPNTLILHNFKALRIMHVSSSCLETDVSIEFAYNPHLGCSTLQCRSRLCKILNMCVLHVLKCRRGGSAIHCGFMKFIGNDNLRRVGRM